MTFQPTWLDERDARRAARQRTRGLTRLGLLLSQAAAILFFLALVGHAVTLAVVALMFAGLNLTAWVYPSRTHTLTITCVDPPEQITVGTETRLALLLTTSRRGGLPGFGGTFRTPLAEAMPFELRSLPPEGITVTFPVTPMRHGWLSEAQVESVDAGLWGLFRTTVVHPVTFSGRVAVVPATGPVLAPPLPPPSFVPGEEDGEGPAVARGTSPRGVREFRVGDEPRSVHWRATARAGRLTVREWDPPRPAAGLIVVPVLGPVLDPIADEVLLAALASIGLAAADQGRALGLTHTGGTRVPLDRAAFLTAFADVGTGLPPSLPDLVGTAAAAVGPGAGVVLGVTSPFRPEVYSAASLIAQQCSVRLDIITSGQAVGTTYAPGHSVTPARVLLDA